MITATATTLTAADVLVAIATRRIAVTPVFDGAIWSASIEIRGESDHNRRRILRTVSATGPSPMAAVAALIAKLEGEQARGP
jgi:hypothetical protein